jgi:hypothetical protein
MSKAGKILSFIVLFLAIILITSCSPTRKNPYYKKKREASKVNTEQLGRNRYYFSQGYQKKLNKTFRKK